jgi:hypothetical protein
MKKVMMLCLAIGIVGLQVFQSWADTLPQGLEYMNVQQRNVESGITYNRLYWSLPENVTGQDYSVGITSMDGTREYARTGRSTDSKSLTFSFWDLRAMPQGNEFAWFVRIYDSQRDTMIQTSSSEFFTYNLFNITIEDE